MRVAVRCRRCWGRGIVVSQAYDNASNWAMPRPTHCVQCDGSGVNYEDMTPDELKRQRQIELDSQLWRRMDDLPLCGRCNGDPDCYLCRWYARHGA